MKGNKKGQEMSVATLVLIVIGIVVLVMLILGFSMGWKNLWGKINVFGGGSNMETVIQSCQIAATSDSVYSYCNEWKRVTVDGKTQYVNCADKRVEDVLDKKIACPNTATAVADQCAVLRTQKVDVDGPNGALVNGGKCTPVPVTAPVAGATGATCAVATQVADCASKVCVAATSKCQ